METLINALQNGVKFKNHYVFPNGTFLDLFFAIVPLVLLEILLRKRDLIWWRKWPIFWLFFILYPNAAYLFTEMRHYVLTDTIADERDMASFAFFAVIGTIGLFLATIYSIRMSMGIKPFNKSVKVSVSAFSLFASIGTAFGLKGLHSLVGLVYPPTIIIWGIPMLSSPKWLIFIAMLWGLLTAVGMTSYWIISRENSAKLAKANL